MKPAFSGYGVGRSTLELIWSSRRRGVPVEGQELLFRERCENSGIVGLRLGEWHEKGGYRQVRRPSRIEPSITTRIPDLQLDDTIAVQVIKIFAWETTIV
jgi:hypothetical protein